MEKKRSRRFYSIQKTLAQNSISALFVSIEIYNKPNVSYRNQTVILMLAHSWEILLKSILYSSNKKIKEYINGSLNETEWDDQIWLYKVVELFCVWKDKLALKEHLDLLRETRNKVMHAYIFPKDLDGILWGLFQKSFEFYDQILMEYFPDLKTEMAFPFILPIWFQKPYDKSSFLKSFWLRDNPFYLDLLSASERLNNEWVDETVIVPISFFYDKKNKVTNAELVVAIDPTRWETINFKKSISLALWAQRTESPIPLDECRHFFTISANELRKKYKLFKKKENDLSLIYSEIIDEKYHQFYWWKDPNNSKRFFSIYAENYIKERITQLNLS